MVLESRPALEEQLLTSFKHSEWPEYDYDSDWPKEEWCNKCNAARIFEKLVWDPPTRAPLAPTPPQATLMQSHTQQWRAEGGTCEISKSQKYFGKTSLKRHKKSQWLSYFRPGWLKIYQYIAPSQPRHQLQDLFRRLASW